MVTANHYVGYRMSIELVKDCFTDSQVHLFPHDTMHVRVMAHEPSVGFVFFVEGTLGLRGSTLVCDRLVDDHPNDDHCDDSSNLEFIFHVQHLD